MNEIKPGTQHGQIQADKREGQNLLNVAFGLFEYFIIGSHKTSPSLNAYRRIDLGLKSRATIKGVMTQLLLVAALLSQIVTSSWCFAAEETKTDQKPDPVAQSP